HRVYLSGVRPPPRSTRCPYTTLFRSRTAELQHHHLAAARQGGPGRELGLLFGFYKDGDGHDVDLGNGKTRLGRPGGWWVDASLRSEEHTSELQSREKLVCRVLPEEKK